MGRVWLVRRLSRWHVDCAVARHPNAAGLLHSATGFRKLYPVAVSDLSVDREGRQKYFRRDLADLGNRNAGFARSGVIDHGGWHPVDGFSRKTAIRTMVGPTASDFAFG